MVWLEDGRGVSIGWLAKGVSGIWSPAVAPVCPISVLPRELYPLVGEVVFEKGLQEGSCTLLGCIWQASWKRLRLTSRRVLQEQKSRRRHAACSAVPCGFKLFCLMAEILNTEHGEVPAVDVPLEGVDASQWLPPVQPLPRDKPPACWGTGSAAVIPLPGCCFGPGSQGSPTWSAHLGTSWAAARLPGLPSLAPSWESRPCLQGALGETERIPAAFFFFLRNSKRALSGAWMPEGYSLNPEPGSHGRQGLAGLQPCTQAATLPRGPGEASWAPDPDPCS